MVNEFLIQICDIMQTTRNSQVLDDLGKPISQEVTVVTGLKCREDPTRYRSRENWSEKAGEAIESSHLGFIYTDWTTVKITNDMRIRIYAGVDSLNKQLYDYYNIVSANALRDLAGTGHHYEIEFQKSYNV